MTSLRVICGLGPPPIKNPGYAYDPKALSLVAVLECDATVRNRVKTIEVFPRNWQINSKRLFFLENPSLLQIIALKKHKTVVVVVLHIYPPVTGQCQTLTIGRSARFSLQ